VTPGGEAPVVLIGANGQLGSDLVREFESKERPLVAMTRADIELRDHEQVAEALEAVRPSVIVNTAAFHKVEACEADVEQAFAVNCIAVRNLALVADRLGSRLVHLSTDYVFDGESDVPYTDEAAPNPINAYGTSKAAGEFFIRGLCRRHLIVRTSGLYGLAGSSGKGGNFIQTMLKLGRQQGVVSVVTDQVLSPTYTLDLARLIWRLVEADSQGLFHATNSGSCSWYEFARTIFELSGVPAEVRPVTTASMGAAVRRPRYSVLANGELENAGFGVMRPWREALADYLQAAGAAVSQGPAPQGAGVNSAEN
jgi:dTDP-4-dehydrorhamnose reductase